MRILFLFLAALMPFEVVAESASITRSSVASLGRASQERRALCERVKRDPTCINRGQDRLLRSLVNTQIPACQATIQSQNCSQFFKQNPEYARNAMKCDAYSVCSLSLESTTVEGCKRFGLEVRDSFVRQARGAAECAGTASCVGRQALQGLQTVLNPVATVARVAVGAAQQVRTDIDKFQQMACLDPVTQAQFQCYLLANYGSLAAGGVGVVARAGTVAARMANLSLKMRRLPPLPDRPIGKPNTTAIDDYNRLGRGRVEVKEVGSQTLIVDQSGKVIFGHKYGLRSNQKGEIYFNKIDVGDVTASASARGNGFYSYLMHKMFKENPNVRLAKADLQQTNAKVIGDLVDRGYSVQDAIRQSPSYRVYAQNGFTQIDWSSVKLSRDRDGKISQVIYFARKP